MADTVVYSQEQLAAAVVDMSIDTIYFGADITLEEPVTIPADKTSLVFDGTFEGVTYRFTDMDGLTAFETINVNEVSNIAITFQNMIMSGRNYYGIPCIFETVNTSGVSVTYQKITYTGPQLVHNPMGLTRFIDCDISILAPNAQEVGEVCRVEFEGENILRHNASADATKGVFWFRGENEDPYLKVLTDARVTVNTTNYFMYNLVPVFFPATSNPVRYELQPGASFTLTAGHGISHNPSHVVSYFLVGAGASFRYVQESTNLLYASLYITGAFTVNEGANVYMQAAFAGAQPLLHYPSGAGNLLNINNPKSFVLYNQVTSPLTKAGLASRPFTITSEQLNHWNPARAFPTAGTFADTPQNKWCNADWGTFTMSGTASSVGTNAIGIGLIGPQPPFSSFTFQSARVISAGNLVILPDPVIDNGRPITGQTEPNAKLMVSFSVDGQEHRFENITADGEGRFEIDPDMMIPIGTVVSISVNTPFLIKTIVTLAVSEGEISIISAPERIAFTTPPVSTNPVLLRRLNPEEAVEVLDSRPYSTSWKLLAFITGPLEAENGEVLENAVVFKDDDMLWELGETPMVVHAGGPGEGQYEVYWPEDKGILVRVIQPIHSGVEYSTQLGWVLEVEPED